MGVNGPVWDEDAGLALPSLVGAARADVCVIGLGGSGLTAVHELRSRGIDVVGLDAGPVAGGAAGRNGGFLLGGLAHAHHQVRGQLGAQAAVLYRQSLEELERVAATTPGEVRRTGSLRIERTVEGLADCAAQVTAMRADDLPVEEYDGPEGVGLLFPADAVMQPMRRCRGLARACLAEGARLFERSRVTAIGSGQVVTEHGSVTCRTVLVLVDHPGALLPELAVIRPVRLQMLATAPMPPRFDRPVYLRGGMEYWQQLPDGRLALGGLRDVGGTAEETDDATPTAAVQGALTAFLREDLGVEAEVTHRWAATVGYTTDALPYLGQVRQGVWAAGGYCGTGNLVGALCGRELAARVTGAAEGTYFGWSRAAPSSRTVSPLA